MAAATIIDGKALAADLRRRIGEAAASLRTAHHLVPGLAVVLVGDNPASAVYVRTKARHSEEAGFASFLHRLPADVREREVLTLVHGLNDDPRVHGILVQLPLPAHIRSDVVIQAVSPHKDVDGFHVVNVGRLASGAADAMVPCTPSGCLMLIKSQRRELAGCNAVVVGRSLIVGKPMAQLLLAEHCTVTVAHSRTADLAGECRRADVLVVAVGRPAFVRGDWIKPGATVIDVGINRIEVDGKAQLIGDVAFDEAIGIAGAVTPVPGGVGPMTVACLMRNTLIAACTQRKLPTPEL